MPETAAQIATVTVGPEIPLPNYLERLRDDLAARAVAGLATSPKLYNTPGDLARKAYQIADECLKARIHGK